NLHESQRAFADILLLSRARQIVGPAASAFSRLAANLAGLTITKADHLMDERQAERCMHEGVMQALKGAADSDVLRPLVARDICWF
ncbi:hypothetical protein NL529_30955, partial [Klebsiella pneumoniae]|nr:hypothetical protein [Klebsiella pneumoniae]